MAFFIRCIVISICFFVISNLKPRIPVMLPITFNLVSSVKTTFEFLVSCYVMTSSLGFSTVFSLTMTEMLKTYFFVAY